MTVTYRSLSRFKRGDLEIEHLILEQFYKWLRDDPKSAPRRFNTDKLEMNSLTKFSNEAECLLAEQILKDGSKTIRGRLVENKFDEGLEEKWIST